MILRWMRRGNWFTYSRQMLQVEKNYSYFGGLLSFDSTYSTNQYDMIFAFFTGVNHHLQSVLFGVVFLLNERIESYEWLFQTFLHVMEGKVKVHLDPLMSFCV
jgi:hypothetical protein